MEPGHTVPEEVLESKRRRLLATAGSFAVAAISGLLVQIASVRILGEVDYGSYVAVIASVALAELFVLNRGGELALGVLGEAWANDGRGEFGALTRRLYMHDLPWVLGGYAGLAGLALLFGDRLGWPATWVLVAATCLPIQLGYGADKALLIVSGRVVAHVRMEAIISLAMGVLGIGLVLLFGVWGLLVAYPGGALVKVVLIRVLALKVRRELARNHPPVPSARVIASSTQVSTTLRNILNAVSEQIDVLIVNALAGSAAAAHYRIAKSLASLPGRAFGPLWSALRPEMIRYWYLPDRTPIRSLLRKPVTLTAIGGAIVVPAAWFVAPPLIEFAYGVSSTSIVPALGALLVSSLALAGMAGWYRFLMLVDDDKLRSLRWAAALMAWNLVLGLAIGAQGALAMALVVAAGQLALAASAVVWLLRETRPPG